MLCSARSFISDHITIDNSYYLLSICATKKAYFPASNIKWEIMNKETPLKKGVGYYFDSTTKFEDFDFNDILPNENSHEDILIYNISYKTLIGGEPLRIRFDKIEGFIRIMMGIDI